MTEPLGTMARFKGTAVVITGAASGIGAATARRLVSEGASVGLCDIDGDALDAIAAELGLESGRVYAETVDVADGEAVAYFVSNAAHALGKLDVLVNNAGIGCFGHVDEVTPDAWRHTLAVDLDAVFFGSRAALSFLRGSRGCIVNTASISGNFADPGLVAYNVAKAGVISLTRAMAVDHAAEGIRVNCVCPGGVSTPMLKAHMRDTELMDEYRRLVPMARLGTPEEVAAAIAFLASADATYITGVALTVDGGVTAQTGQPNFDRLYRERGWDKAIQRRAARPNQA